MPGSIATNATKDFSVSTIFVVTCSSTKPRGRRSNALMPGATRALTERLTLAAMSAVYTYTCENTSASYVGLCLQERIRLLGTSKAAAQNEQEWIANDSKIRWLQRSWTSMPTYADADFSFGSRLAYELQPLSAVVCTGDENPNRCRS
ncbi:hypothetical protein KCU93_g136, partial [Aureobasidium melanogenum]